MLARSRSSSSLAVRMIPVVAISPSDAIAEMDVISGNARSRFRNRKQASVWPSETPSARGNHSGKQTSGSPVSGETAFHGTPSHQLVLKLDPVIDNLCPTPRYSPAHSIYAASISCHRMPSEAARFVLVSLRRLISIISVVVETCPVWHIR
jgi:hypothetical protein